MMTKILFLLFLLVTLSNCKQRAEPSLYASLVSDAESACIQNHCLDAELCLRAFYKPHDYMVVSELRSNTVSNEEYDKIREELESLVYITLALYTNSGENPAQYLTKVQGQPGREAIRQMIDLNIASALTLVADGTDTLSCVLHHLEQTYGATPFESVNLAFEPLHQEFAWHELELHYRDFLIGSEPVVFHFNSKDIGQLPGLKLTRL